MTTTAIVRRNLTLLAGVSVMAFISSGQGEVLPSNSAETNVLKALTNGRAAAFSNAEPHTIAGTFLAGLLTDAGSNAPVGVVRITGAEIEGKLDLSNGECLHEIQLEGCRFTDAVSFRNARVPHTVSFAQSIFEKELDLSDVKIDGHLKLSKASFNGNVSASFAEIRGNLIANGAFFSGAAQFNQIKVGFSANFDSSMLDTQRLENLPLTTNAALKLVQAFIADEPRDKPPLLRFPHKGFGIPTGTSLQSGEWLIIQEAPLQMFSVSVAEKEVKVSRKTYFADGIDLESSNIGSFLHANSVCFSGRVNANSLNVGTGAYFGASRFEGDVTFGYASLGHEFVADFSVFTNANFYQIKADRVMLNNTLFLGTAQFEQSTITTAIEAKNAAFSDTNVSVSFYGAKVNEIDFSGTVFCGKANFGNISVSRFQMRSAWFTNAHRPVIFHALNVEGTASFDNVVFDGPVNFLLANIKGNLGLENTRFENTLTTTNLRRVTDGISTYNADFGGMRVAGFANLARAELAGRISFRAAEVGSLHLDEMELIHPKRTTNQLRLEGLSYKAIRYAANLVSTHGAEEMAESWTNLQALLQRHTPYSFDIYDKLENYFAREGAGGLASKVFIAGKRRERKEIMDWWSPSHLVSLILDWTVGYGRHPSRALFLSLVPIAFGCWIFRRKHMVPSDHEDPDDSERPAVSTGSGPGSKSVSVPSPASSPEPGSGNVAKGKYPYHPLWFSLDVFLPIIDLWADEHWVPKRSEKWRWIYMLVHKFLGWVLIPIGLAAFSGIIK